MAAEGALEALEELAASVAAEGAFFYVKAQDVSLPPDPLNVEWTVSIEIGLGSGWMQLRGHSAELGEAVELARQKWTSANVVAGRQRRMAERDEADEKARADIQRAFEPTRVSRPAPTKVIKKVTKTIRRDPIVKKVVKRIVT